ncbi:MAG: S1-like domain-containing RNA-binding protein [Bacteroidales bacterium]|jgi:predicted RNA-binding protein (virulence factor B family)|nr:S1-like domain-containing RNA-binding protein [Bacteroidales bacterium]
MITLGEYNILRIDRILEQGAYLVDEENNDVLLPNKYMVENAKVDDEVEVFVYNDSEDRLIATNLTPKFTLNEFAFLQVIDVNRFGAFLDWGLEKDIMVPFSEQNQRMEIDRWYVIRLLLDEKTNRLVASNKLNKFIETDFISVEVGEEVDLLVIERSDLGYTLIINNVHKGLAFANETFRELNVGETLTGYVKNIREDGKIDISLQKQGYQNVEPSAIQILELLKENGGFLALTDKSEPEAIYSQLEMSKKTFKKAIGGLYKSKLIRISEEGIYLL